MSSTEKARKAPGRELAAHRRRGEAEPGIALDQAQVEGLAIADERVGEGAVAHRATRHRQLHVTGLGVAARDHIEPNRMDRAIEVDREAVSQVERGVGVVESEVVGPGGGAEGVGDLQRRWPRDRIDEREPAGAGATDQRGAREIGFEVDGLRGAQAGDRHVERGFAREAAQSRVRRTGGQQAAGGESQCESDDAHRCPLSDAAYD